MILFARRQHDELIEIYEIMTYYKQLLLSPEACFKNNNNEAIIEDRTLKRCPATKTEDIIVLVFSIQSTTHCG